MKYYVKEARFIHRDNRFVGRVYIDQKEHRVHIPSTGRLTELLIPGAKCFVEPANNPNRKTGYTLITVEKNGACFNIDSMAPNAVVADGLASGKVEQLESVENIAREKTYGNSRFDLRFYNPRTEKQAYMEVKGVTLEENGIASFPASPTSRGRKHLDDLVSCVKDGYEAYIFFLLQFEKAEEFKPHRIIDPLFSKKLAAAKREGVRILCYNSHVTKNSIRFGKKVPVSINEVIL